MSKLKSCPFCGGEARVSIGGDSGGSNGWVTCNDCEADGPCIGFDKPEKEAVDAWNNRVKLES